MLVDLARNDLGRVCRPGSVSVERLMAVERYSHVMHLTSDGRGHIRGDRGTDELIRAMFPAGTMTGTPKVPAMEIIDDLEPSRRWLYSGAVGSFGLSHVDLYLTIRSMVLCDGKSGCRRAVASCTTPSHSSSTPNAWRDSARVPGSLA